jgi:hypothetical protein
MLRAITAGACFAIRSAVTIFVEATGLLLDLGALAVVDLGAAFLVSDFYDTAMVKSSHSLRWIVQLKWVRLITL